MKPHLPLLFVPAWLGLSVACASEPTTDSHASDGAPTPGEETPGGPAPTGDDATPVGDGTAASPTASGVGTAPAAPSATPTAGSAPTGLPEPAASMDVGTPGPGGTAEPEPTDTTDTPDTSGVSHDRLVGAVTFSVPSGTFEGALSVTMMAATTGEIRYTTDGLLPTASSPLYDGAPLELTETTQLRAQLFEGEMASGSPSTAIYIRRTFDVSSDIPLIIMEAYGAGKPPTEAGPEKVIFRDLGFMLFEPVDGEASISAAPTWATRAGYHVRGQSSANFEKTPYRVELWDNYDQDTDYPMIGMAPESDWALVGPYTDKTLVRNAFVYSLAADMGLEAPELRFAEVYINQDDGPIEPEDYQGVYAVTETIKNSKNRLDLEQLRPEDTLEADLSGGYIFKFDEAALREDEGEIEIHCMSDEMSGEDDEASDAGTGFGLGNARVGDCFEDMELKDPSAPNAEQLSWIQAYVQQAHDSLHAEPIGDYQQYFDLASFVDQFLLNEFTKGGDIYTRSVYMHKERDELIKAGPVWDYNFTLGNYTSDLEGWQLDDGRPGSNDWFDILFEQPEFLAAAATRWRELRAGIFSDAEIAARIDLVSAPLVNAAQRDLAKWPIGEGGLFGGRNNNTDDAEADAEMSRTWEDELATMKQWALDRMVWLDAEFASL